MAGFQVSIYGRFWVSTEAEWGQFWWGYSDHMLKNEIGRVMLMGRNNLLPMLTPHFREAFPFFGVSPEALEAHKQAMLYVSWDAGRRTFVAPRDDFAVRQIENSVLIEEVEDIVRYVARNNQANVFEPRVLEEYHRLNTLALDEADRHWLLDLFYATVLRTPTGSPEEKPLHAVLGEVRGRHPDEALL